MFRPRHVRHFLAILRCRLSRIVCWWRRGHAEEVFQINGTNAIFVRCGRCGLVTAGEENVRRFLADG